METVRLATLHPMTYLARVAISLGATKGNTGSAERHAEARFRDTPSVARYLKGAITAMTTDALAEPEFVATQALEALRKGTIAGRMLASMRRVPLNTRYPKVTASTSFSWVGEGRPKPLTSMAFDTGTLGIAKVSGICVFTDELIEFARPGSQDLIRRDMEAGITEFLDEAFIDPSVAAVADVSPASITNGITPTQSTGDSAIQIAADLETVATGMADDDETDSLFWIMTRADAIRLAAKRDTAGGPAFPGVKVNGGELLGIPVITSNAVPHSLSGGSMVALVNASGIDYAEIEAVDIAVSTSATLQMLDNPTNDVTTPTPTTMVSMYQSNSIAVGVTLYRNYQRARDTAVAYLDNVHW